MSLLIRDHFYCYKGQFIQNVSRFQNFDFQANMGEVTVKFLEPYESPNETMKFMASPYAPYVSVERSLDASVFNISGPLFTLFAEAALYMNLRYLLILFI